MAVGTYLISPVERNQPPLVVRRSGVQDHQQREKSPYEQSKSNHREEQKPQEMAKRMLNCIMSGSHIDCRI